MEMPMVSSLSRDLNIIIMKSHQSRSFEAWYVNLRQAIMAAGVKAYDENQYALKNAKKLQRALVAKSVTPAACRPKGSEAIACPLYLRKSGRHLRAYRYGKEGARKAARIYVVQG